MLDNNEEERVCRRCGGTFERCHPGHLMQDARLVCRTCNNEILVPSTNEEFLNMARAGCAL